MQIKHEYKATYSKRRVIAITMTALYLAIVFTPLLPLVSSQAAAAHTSAKECSGNCVIDGCSAQSRISKSCCCAKKNKQEQHHDAADTEMESCCSTAPSKPKPTIIACGCPCDNNKEWFDYERKFSEIILQPYTNVCAGTYEVICFGTSYVSLITHNIEPPDPPPKLI